MTSRKGYQITEIGEFPIDWKVAPLSYGTESLKSGLSRKLSDQDIGIPCLRTNCIRNNYSISLDDLKYWYVDDPQGANTEDYHLLPNDILVGFINSMAQIGKCCIYKGFHRDTIYTTNIFRFRTNLKLIPYYFVAFAKTGTYRKQIEQITKPAVNQASFTTGDFKSILLPFPSVTEQQKIADILSTVDAHISETESLIEKTKVLKQGMMQRLLTKGIGHTEFKDTEIGRIPIEWEVVELGTVFERVAIKNKVGNTNIMTISANQGLVNQLEYFNNSYASKDTSNYSLLQRGDFAYNKSYSSGYPMGVIKLLEKYESGIVSPLYICMRLKIAEAKQDFYKYYFDSDKLAMALTPIAKEGVRNHGLLNVAIPDFFSMPIAYLPSEEQQQIASILSSMDDQIDAYQTKLTALTKLKSALMQQLLTGKTRVKI